MTYHNIIIFGIHSAQLEKNHMFIYKIENNNDILKHTDNTYLLINNKKYIN